MIDYNVVVQCGKCRVEGVVGAMHLPEMHVLDESQIATWPEVSHRLRCHPCCQIEVDVTYVSAIVVITRLLQRQRDIEDRRRHEVEDRQKVRRFEVKRCLELGDSPNDIKRRHWPKPAKP